MSKPLTQIVTYAKYAPICVSGFSLLFISSVKIVAKATAIRRRAYRREPCLIYHAANRATLGMTERVGYPHPIMMNGGICAILL